MIERNGGQPLLGCGVRHGGVTVIMAMIVVLMVMPGTGGSVIRLTGMRRYFRQSCEAVVTRPATRHGGRREALYRGRQHHQANEARTEFFPHIAIIDTRPQIRFARADASCISGLPAIFTD